MAESIRDAILGCILGGAIGDAMGHAYENSATGSMEKPARRWVLSDDTQLTLATCEAIAECREVDPEKIATQFVAWYRHGRLTGLGSSTLKALRDLDAGAHWALSGRSGDRAAGNGAAIRIAPLAFLLTKVEYEERRLIRDVSRITHHHDEAYAAALAVVDAIQASRAGESHLSERCSESLPDCVVRDRLREYAKADHEMSFADAAKRFGVSGWAAESVPFAIWAAEKCGDDFDSLLTNIIACGGDTDSNASIAGQIVGARLGYSKLPERLISQLPSRDLIHSTAQALADAVES